MTQDLHAYQQAVWRISAQFEAIKPVLERLTELTEQVRGRNPDSRKTAEEVISLYLRKHPEDACFQKQLRAVLPSLAIEDSFPVSRMEWEDHERCS